jgi:hypothetical protein
MATGYECEKLTGLTDVIDVDDPTTWPAIVEGEVQRLADRVRGTTQYVSDLPLPIEGEEAFRSLLSGFPLRAYHATRLLPHEVRVVRRRGLRLSTQELVIERLGQAHELGIIDDDLHGVLKDGNVFAHGEAEYRRDQVCLFISREIMQSANNFGYLLTHWGGEVLTRSSGCVVARPRLSSIGTPTIVVVAIHIGRGSGHFVTPSLDKVFVGKWLELEGLGADVFCRAPVRAEDIIDIWQPGHPEFELQSSLPRS